MRMTQCSISATRQAKLSQNGLDPGGPFRIYRQSRVVEVVLKHIGIFQHLVVRLVDMAFVAMVEHCRHDSNLLIGVEDPHVADDRSDLLGPILVMELCQAGSVSVDVVKHPGNGGEFGIQPSP